MKKEFIGKFFSVIGSNLVVLNKEQIKFFKSDFKKDETFSLTYDGIELKFHNFSAEDGTLFCLVSEKSSKFDVFGKIENFDPSDSITLNGEKCSFVLIDEMPVPVKKTAKSTKNTKKLIPDENIAVSETFSDVDKHLENLHKKQNQEYNDSKLNSTINADLYAEINLSDEPEKTDESPQIEKVDTNNAKDFLINKHIFAQKPDFQYQGRRDGSGLIKERKDATVWFHANFFQRNTDLFWQQLIAHYNTEPKELEQTIKAVTQSKKLPVNELVEIQLDNLPQQPTILEKLQKKIIDLNHKNQFLADHIGKLKEEIENNNEIPENNEDYLAFVKQKKETEHLLELSNLNLNTYQSKIDAFINKTSDFKLRFYVHAFGQQSLLSKYDEFIGDKILHLNQQINEITIKHQQLEQTLFDSLYKLHEAKKTKAKFQFLAREEDVSEFLARQQKTKEEIFKSQKKAILEEVGQLHENAALIQERINKENKRINYFLDNLKTLDNVSDYEAELKKVKEKKQELAVKKDKFSQYLYKLKLKMSVIEEGSNIFYSELCKIVSDFQEEVLDVYTKHKTLLSFSTEKLWNEWNSKGLSLINNIFLQKKSIIDNFADVVYLQVKNIYHYQKKALIEANKRQKKWDEIYQEIKKDFESMGYLLAIRKPNQLDHKYIEQLDINSLSLSPESKKVLFYQPNFSPSTKGIPLFGLEPRLVDNKHFLVIDQVWNDLTPQQEAKIKEKLLQENATRDKELLEEKLRKIKEQLFDSLSAQKYQFKKNHISDFLPEDKQPLNVDDMGFQFEEEVLTTWKKQNFLHSNAVAQFKETIYNFSKKLFSLKSVDVVNSEIKISETGQIDGDPRVEILSDNDYFIKSQNNKDFSLSESQFDVSVDDSDLYDIDDENYMEIINSIDDEIEQRMVKEFQPPKPPSLEEWAQLSIKKYREKRKTYDAEMIQERLLELDSDIKKISLIQEKYQEVFNSELTKRNFLFNDMKEDLGGIKQFLAQSEYELNHIIDEAKKEINKNFEELGKNI